KIENQQTGLTESATYKRSLLCCAPNCAPLSPDGHLLQLVRLLFDCIHQPGSLVRGEPLEACHHVRFGHVDVIALGNTRGAVPHQSRQREFIHAALSAPRPEGVTPAVELKRL